MIFTQLCLIGEDELINNIGYHATKFSLNDKTVATVSVKNQLIDMNKLPRLELDINNLFYLAVKMGQKDSKYAILEINNEQVNITYYNFFPSIFYMLLSFKKFYNMLISDKDDNEITITSSGCIASCLSLCDLEELIELIIKSYKQYEVRQ